MPDSLEFPRMLSSVIKLMSGKRRAGFGRSIVNEFIALTLGHAVGTCGFAGRCSGLMPSLASIIRALDDLPKPSTGLGSINAVGIRGRTFQVIEFPACEVRPANFPFIALAISSKNECAFARTDQYSYLAHAAFSL